MKFALYLGCVIPNRYPGIEAATRKVMPKLGVELVDIQGASCCPAPGVIRSFDKETWLLTAARNLAIAEDMGLDIVTLCNGCYATLKEANHILKTDDTAIKHVNMVLAEIGRKYNGNINVKHIAEVLYFNVGVEAIKKSVIRKIQLEVAAFYGCHLIKPSQLRPWGSKEKPKFLDEMVEALGAKSIPYRDKMMCCGAGGGLRSASLDISLNITRERLQTMKEAGAQCIVNVCPFCHLQFDLGQRQITQRHGGDFNIPVIYYTQLLGLAMGFNPEGMGIYMNVTECKNLVSKVMQV